MIIKNIVKYCLGIIKDEKQKPLSIKHFFKRWNIFGEILKHFWENLTLIIWHYWNDDFKTTNRAPQSDVERDKFVQTNIEEVLLEHVRGKRPGLDRKSEVRISPRKDLDRWGLRRVEERSSGLEIDSRGFKI